MGSVRIVSWAVKPIARLMEQPRRTYLHLTSLHSTSGVHPTYNLLGTIAAFEIFRAKAETTTGKKLR